MAPTAKLDYRCSTCPINLCTTECQCVETNNKNETKTDINANESVEIIAKGQNLFALTLRTLRLNKSTTLTNEADDGNILNEEKCRPIITLREVADHDTYDDCWIILYDRVYDVTEFLNQHPGGFDVILEHAGRDATVAFSGHSRFALMSLKLYEIGELPEKERIYRRPGLLKCDELPE